MDEYTVTHGAVLGSKEWSQENQSGRRDDWFKWCFQRSVYGSDIFV